MKAKSINWSVILDVLCEVDGTGCVLAGAEWLAVKRLGFVNRFGELTPRGVKACRRLAAANWIKFQRKWGLQ